MYLYDVAMPIEMSLSFLDVIMMLRCDCDDGMVLVIFEASNFGRVHVTQPRFRRRTLWLLGGSEAQWTIRRATLLTHDFESIASFPFPLPITIIMSGQVELTVQSECVSASERTGRYCSAGSDLGSLRVVPLNSQHRNCSHNVLSSHLSPSQARFPEAANLPQREDGTQGHQGQGEEERKPLLVTQSSY